MAFGILNSPNIGGQELDAVRSGVQKAQETADAAKSAAVVMKAATGSAAGTAGLAPAPAAGAQNKYLRGDGTWQTPPDTNTTYTTATQSASGLMSAADKQKLDGVATGANAYSLPAATASVRGGVKTGYVANGKNYPVQLSNEQMFVNVPWTDTTTSYNTATQSVNGLMSAADKKKLDGVATGANAYSLPAASSSARGGVKTGYAANGKNYPVQLSNEQMFVNVPWTDTNTTYSAATQSANGLMSAADKQKLDGIAAGANVNTVTGIKGSEESSYRTGNVNITAANVGAATASHTHSYLPLSGGTVSGYTKIQNIGIGENPADSNGSATNGIKSLSGGIHIFSNNESSGIYLRGKEVLCLGIGNNSYKTIFAASFSVGSSRRFKENFSDITEDEAKALLKISPQHFDYINGKKGQSGFVAEDVEPFYPEICSYRKDIDQADDPDAPERLQGLDYSKFTPYIVKLLQMQQTEINAQREKINALEYEIEQLKSHLKE